MHMPLSLNTHGRTYYSTLSNDFYRKSYYPKLHYSFNDDEQILKPAVFSDIHNQLKRKSIHSSSFSILPLKMQQQTTNSVSDEMLIGVPSRSCSVCGDVSTGIHFGGNSCESCKAFFRRSVQCNRYQNYKCSNEERCPVNIVTRKVCQFCRYNKCTSIGMKPKWVLSDQEREEKYGPRRKRFRENHPTEEDPEIYKYLTKEEKTLIEDMAHAFYQSRATYPLKFPSQLNEYLTSLSTEKEQTMAFDNSPNPSANFLIVPIQRLVLFARMLKDFDLFAEDDKVNLLKASAIEIMICSSNTLFNSKTHTFINYLSRDQRALMDENVMPLDPLLKKLWGEEVFQRTKNFLISMCNLHIDEVTSTLLAPIILFSPDRSNIKDLNLVKHLQIKYATLIRKYMTWRYGIEKTDQIYPKLLLQIINIRTLSVAHAEIIQKVMSTSNVNPLVQEVTAKHEVLNKSTTEKLNSLSLISNPIEADTADSDKTASLDAESTIGSDEDETLRKKGRSSIDEDGDFYNEDLNETSPKNIWRKRQKVSTAQDEITNIEENNLPKPQYELRPEKNRSNSNEIVNNSNSNYVYRRPHDHIVPNFISSYPDDLSMSNRNSFRYLPLKKQSFVSNREHLHEKMYHPHSSSMNDLSSYEHHSRSNQYSNSTMLPPASTQYYHQQYNRIPPDNFPQQSNEQHLRFLPLANNQTHIPPIHSPNNHQSHSGKQLDADEQQLLNAIHSHPNKRDLVLNLLRQVNESSLPSAMDYRTDSNYHMQQCRSDPSANYDQYRTHK